MAGSRTFRGRPRLDAELPPGWLPTGIGIPRSTVLWRRGRFRFHRSGIVTLVFLLGLAALPVAAGVRSRHDRPTYGGGVIDLTGRMNDDPLRDMLIAFVVALGWGLVVSIVHHELAHALVARRFGVRAEAIGFHGGGGYVIFGTPPETSREAVWISAAGPLSNLVVGAVLLVAWAATGGGNTDATAILLVVAGTCELTVGAVNLIPTPTSDGGEILAIVRAARASGVPVSLRRPRA